MRILILRASLGLMLLITLNTWGNVVTKTSFSKLIFGNELITLEFNLINGELVSLINETTGDNYLKHAQGGNMFRLFLNTKKSPLLRAGPHDNPLSGDIVDPRHCALLKHSVMETNNSKILYLTYAHTDSELQIQLVVTLPNGSDQFDADLSLINTGVKDIEALVAFPYFTGVCLGPDRNTNMTVNMWDRGYPGTKAWKKPIGGVYGKEVSMQWQTVYEQNLKQGVAFVCMDPCFENKILSTFPKGGMASFYFDKRNLLPEKAESWPSARILAYNGNWRTAAKAYNNWFTENVATRSLPKWYKEKVTTRSSTWFPTKEAVEENKKSGDESAFTSFEQLHDLFDSPIFGNNINDCMEIAMWNEGVNLWPETYGPWMSSGFIDFRSDLGGIEAFKKGLESCHQYGRKVAMYVAAYGVRTSSPILEGGWEKYAIKGKNGKPVMDYKKGDEKYGAFNCPGYKPWQDNLIRICTMLAEVGIDEIRLDEFGFPFRPCYNEAHHHESPNNANKWMRDCLKRIREATDKINPDLFISTEFYMDYFHESTNGALIMDCPGNEIDAMKIAMPNYLPLSYHASSSEAAITGAIMSKTESRRNNWAWGNVGVEKPDDYDENFVINLKWHELYPTFKEAVTYGEVTEWDPVAENDSKWMGHLWKADSYWVLTGGHIDASPLKEDRVRVKLPELPVAVKEAYEFNVETLEMSAVNIERINDEIYVELKSSVSAVLFPFEHCPPLPIITQSHSNSSKNTSIEVSVSLFSPWNMNHASSHIDNIRLDAPGFEVKKKRKEELLVFNILVNNSTPDNNFHFTVSGDCLKVKRWFQIINN